MTSGESGVWEAEKVAVVINGESILLTLHGMSNRRRLQGGPRGSPPGWLMGVGKGRRQIISYLEVLLSGRAPGGIKLRRRLRVFYTLQYIFLLECKAF